MIHHKFYNFCHFSTRTEEKLKSFFLNEMKEMKGTIIKKKMKTLSNYFFIKYFGNSLEILKLEICFLLYLIIYLIIFNKRNK